MQRILFPTDFSENSWNAIQYAFAFFEGQSLDFHFLHVGFQASADTSEVHTNGMALKAFQANSTHSKLEVLENTICITFPQHKHKLHFHVENTFFIEGVRKAVKSLEIDLIIMGTKGASGLKEATLGSHAGAVITRVKCPALIIPEKANYVAPSSIAFPTDYNLPYKNRVVETLKSFSSYHQSVIKVLRVVRKGGNLEEEQLKNKDFLNDALEGEAHSFHWIKSQELESGLQTFVDFMDVHIIAMVGKNLNFFQRLLFKPKIAKISYHTKIPFLVLHE